MKAFAIYTVLRLALFVAGYAVLGGLWVLVFGQEGCCSCRSSRAIIVSSLLSLKLLAPQRERFAAVVEARAHAGDARVRGASRPARTSTSATESGAQRGLRLSWRLIRVSDWPSTFASSVTRLV